VGKTINMMCFYCNWYADRLCDGKARGCKKFGTETPEPEKVNGG